MERELSPSLARGVMKTLAQFARIEVGAAIARGDLVRHPCEVCRRAYTHAHHDDYAKPLTVRWLCPSHHALWHDRHGPGANRDGRVAVDRGNRCVFCREHGHTRRACPNRKAARRG